MVTSDRMALVRGDPRWLMNNQVQFRTWGVSLLSLQQLVNLVSLVKSQPIFLLSISYRLHFVFCFF